MISQLVHIFNDSNIRVRGKLLGIYGVLIALNALAWVWTLVVFRQYPVLPGTALLAYGFGLRHAADADHIAAIDNITHKLTQEKSVRSRLVSSFRLIICPRSRLLGQSKSNFTLPPDPLPIDVESQIYPGVLETILGLRCAVSSRTIKPAFPGKVGLKLRFWRNMRRSLLRWRILLEIVLVLYAKNPDGLPCGSDISTFIPHKIDGS